VAGRRRRWSCTALVYLYAAKRQGRDRVVGADLTAIQD